MLPGCLVVGHDTLDVIQNSDCVAVVGYFLLVDHCLDLGAYSITTMSVDD